MWKIWYGPKRDNINIKLHLIVREKEYKVGEKAMEMLKVSKRNNNDIGAVRRSAIVWKY